MLQAAALPPLLSPPVPLCSCSSEPLSCPHSPPSLSAECVGLSRLSSLDLTLTRMAAGWSLGRAPECQQEPVGWARLRCLGFCL